MQETKSLDDLGSTQGRGRRCRSARCTSQKLDKLGRAYATGKRKNAVARVWIKPGKRRDHRQRQGLQEVFRASCAADAAAAAALAANRDAPVRHHRDGDGGGLSGQAGAVRHGISKALTYFEPELRAVLKKGGFLTRDSRVVERKKYGSMKARRSFQFSKR